MKNVHAYSNVMSVYCINCIEHKYAKIMHSILKITFKSL